jgi:exosortase
VSSGTHSNRQLAEWTLVERLLVAAPVALAMLLSIPAIIGLSGLLQRNQFYAHAYALPVVAAYLAWGNRRQIRRALRDLQPPRFGALVVLATGVFEIAMFIGSVRFAEGIGIALLLGAVAYGIGGVRLLKPFLLPLAFLVLMIPPPGFLRNALLVRLKLMVTDIAVSLFQAAGVTIAAEGNRILVPGHTLFVADACSGLTSIVTMMPLACIVAYFASHGVWRRLVIVGSIFPLAIGANIFRVAVTVAMVSTWGIEAAQGVLHESFGMLTYALGTLALIGTAKVLR